MNPESSGARSSGQSKITLSGAVSMGTGVMIGAGVFALMGQVAGTAGRWFPLAFLAAALVAAITSYSSVKLSNTFPSAGGIGMFVNQAYGVIVGQQRIARPEVHGVVGTDRVPVGTIVEDRAA